MSGDPLEALEHLETLIVRCGQCSPDVQRSIDAVRTRLRVLLSEPEDPLEDAAHAVRRAEYQLRSKPGLHVAALIYELSQAASCIARARQLRG